MNDKERLELEREMARDEEMRKWMAMYHATREDYRPRETKKAGRD